MYITREMFQHFTFKTNSIHGKHGSAVNFYIIYLCKDSDMKSTSTGKFEIISLCYRFTYNMFAWWSMCVWVCSKIIVLRIYVFEWVHMLPCWSVLSTKKKLHNRGWWKFQHRKILTEFLHPSFFIVKTE